MIWVEGPVWGTAKRHSIQALRDCHADQCGLCGVRT